MSRVLARSVGGVGALGAAVYALSPADANGKRSMALGLARLDDAVRPALASVLPAEAFICLYSASRTPFIHALSAAPISSAPASPSACVRAMGLSFRNDLGNAAGLDKDGSLLDFNYSLGAGFAVVGTVLSEPHTGNVFSFFGGLWKGNVWTPLPLSGAALNSLGLPSKGVDVALENIASFRSRNGVPPQSPDRRASGGAKGATSSSAAMPSAAAFPIGVSIMGHPAHATDPAKKQQGVLECVRRSIPLADFIEINESCPNVHHGGGGEHATEELRARLKGVVAVRDQLASELGRRVPILVKMGDLGDPKATVKFLAGLGIDGVVALNTQRNYAAFELPNLDREILEHYTHRYGGGLSGPPIAQVSISQVKAAQAAVRELRLDGAFTVIHVGGLQSAEDMQRSRATGVELRQWYTGLMHGLAQPEPYSLYARVTALK